MPNLIIVYWRDIPAQIIVGKGRKAAKVQLHERFEQAIDSYLAEWRKGDPKEIRGNQEKIAETEARKLEETYDQNTLIELIKNDGWKTRLDN